MRQVQEHGEVRSSSAAAMACTTRIQTCTAENQGASAYAFMPRPASEPVAGQPVPYPPGRDACPHARLPEQWPVRMQYKGLSNDRSALALKSGSRNMSPDLPAQSVWNRTQGQHREHRGQQGRLRGLGCGACRRGRRPSRGGASALCSPGRGAPALRLGQAGELQPNPDLILTLTLPRP